VDLVTLSLRLCDLSLFYGMVAGQTSYFQGCRGYGYAPWVSPWGSPWVWVWGKYGDDLPSPQTNGDSMGIFNQLEITR